MSRSDPNTPRLEDLTAHVAWVRRLASQLVRDPGTADDLAQDACLAALQRPPDDRAPLGTWLATVVRNGARLAWRGADRRADRERRSARDEATPSADQLVERVAVHRSVVDAVLALASPYRETILQRYFDGLTPTEIAARSSVSLATVKTRLARGLARLRLELSDEGDRRTLARALAPLVGPAALGGLPAAPITASPGLGPPLLGILAMSTFAKLAVLTVALAGGIVAVWPDRGAPEALSAPEGSERVVSAEGPRAELEPPVVSRPARDAVPQASEDGTLAARSAPSAEPPLSPAQAPATFDARGIVLGATAAPLADVPLTFTPTGAGARIELVSDRSGTFRLTALAGGGAVTAAEGPYVTVYPGRVERGGSPREVVVVVAPRIALGGRVHDAAGRPVADVRVEVRAPEGFRARFERRLDATGDLSIATTTDTEGRFALATPALPGGELAFLHPLYSSQHRELPLVDHDALDVTLDRPALDDRTIVGLVLDDAGRPVAGADVAYGVHGTVTDVDGAFRIELDDQESPNRLAARMGLTPQRIVAVKDGHQPATLELTLDSATGEAIFPPSIVLRLGGPPLEIRGRVVDPAGQPVTGVAVWVRDVTAFDIGRSGPRSLESILGGRSGDWEPVAVDAAGRFLLSGLADQVYTVAAHDPRTLLRVEREVQAGELDATLVLDHASLWRRVAGRVVDHAGAPVAHVQVRPVTDAFRLRYQGRVVSTDHARTEQVAVTDERGEFELVDMPRELVYLRLDGDEIVSDDWGRHAPGGIAALSDGKVENLEILARLRVHMQVLLADPAEADAVRVLDAEGAPIPIDVVRAGGRSTSREVALGAGRTEVLTVDDRATTLVLVRQGEEVRRVPLALVRGQVNRVDV